MRVRLLAAYTSLFAGVIAGSLVAAPAPSQAWTLNTLHSFCSEAGCVDGDRPQAALLRDPAGNLYGTTEVGGANNSGVVFALKHKDGGWKYQVLHSFCARADCTDGSVMDTPVIMDTSGNLYGTAAFGGAFNCGTVFRLSPGARGGKWRLQTLHDFCATLKDGRWPGSGLSYQGHASGALYDGVSPLYGTTRRAGAREGGVAYALSPGAKGKWKETVLHAFCDSADCADGAEPLGDLLVAGNGDLFGTTSRGGSALHGIAFQLTFASGKWSKKTLYNFCQSENCADGGTPVGPLLQDASGALVGGALEPGDEGVLYKLTPSGRHWHEGVLHTFCGTCTDGYDPMGGVVMDASGNLFGAAAIGGGVNGTAQGVVFELSGAALTPLYTFCSEQNCADGVFPEAPIIMDTAGHIYGATAGGLAEQRGSVFELTP